MRDYGGKICSGCNFRCLFLKKGNSSSWSIAIFSKVTVCEPLDSGGLLFEALSMNKFSYRPYGPFTFSAQSHCWQVHNIDDWTYQCLAEWKGLSTSACRPCRCVTIQAYTSTYICNSSTSREIKTSMAGQCFELVYEAQPGASLCVLEHASLQTYNIHNMYTQLYIFHVPQAYQHTSMCLGLMFANACNVFFYGKCCFGKKSQKRRTSAGQMWKLSTALELTFPRLRHASLQPPCNTRVLMTCCAER